jgi:low temperature requirement protein LtrA
LTQQSLTPAESTTSHTQGIARGPHTSSASMTTSADRVRETQTRHHRHVPFSGRDPDEPHRAATPLELLYDLTFVVAFGTAAERFAHYLALGHIAAAIGGFTVAVVAVSVAWLNYSWFASAYDTDDWVFRIATLIQMVGVTVLALGMREMFASIDHGGPSLDVRVQTLGYVVMRVSMVFLWAQVARQDCARKATARKYIWAIGTAQLVWVTTAFLPLPAVAFIAVGAVVFPVELVGPVYAERRATTPWHAGHVAERHGLLVIITLGEGIVGTVAAVDALVHSADGWTVDAAVLLVAGVGLTFGMWWMYFVVPWGNLLERHRERSAVWSGGHILLFASIAAVGAGLHVAAYILEGRSSVITTAAVLIVTAPLLVFVLLTYALAFWLLGQRVSLNLMLLAVRVGVLGLPTACAAAGLGLAWCVLLLMLTPVITVIAFETGGDQDLASAMARD